MSKSFVSSAIDSNNHKNAEDVERIVAQFCQQQRHWLDLEYASEADPNAEAIRSLRVSDVSVGLFGRAVLRLVPYRTFLPAHSLSTGDEVEVDCTGEKKHDATSSTQQPRNRKRRNRPRGVICAVTDTSISVALSSSSEETSDDDWNAPPYTLLPRSRVEIHQKLRRAIQNLDDAVSGKRKDPCPAQHIIPYLFQVPTDKMSKVNKANETEGTLPVHDSRSASSSFASTSLDLSQREAVDFALSPPYPICCIHGPPGTGKTTTVVEWIRRATLDRGWKLLVAAPSHVAVDQLLERLHVLSSSSVKQPPLRMVRLGHPARVQPQLLAYSLEAMVQKSDGTAIVQDVRKELQQHFRSPTRVNYAEVKRLRLEIRQREEKVVQQLLSQAQIVLCTCVGAASRLLSGLSFDAVVIDEAAQATEAACWIPALLARQQIVLAGDHCQLPPTVLSDVPEVQKGLSTTLFERVMQFYGETPVDGRISRMLQVQYRMHATIANWASQALYRNALQTHESVREQTLAMSFPNAAEDDFMGPLVLLDTAGCDLHDCTNVDGSRYNSGEAELVSAHVRKLLALGLRADQIAVITPYNGQVELLKSTLLPDYPTLPIRSVDGFQGGERDAVIISLVRSSVGGRDGIGFLRDDRRLNVAVTRAQRHCCIICDSETVRHSAFIRNLLDWVETHGEVHSAVEVLSDLDNDVIDKDMAQAEQVLQQLIGQTDFKYPSFSNASSVSKRPSASAPKSDLELGKRRSDLRDRIETFQANSQPGDELTFGTELSSLDRKLVHEIAEELRLEHASGGQEGVNRRIAVSIPVRSKTTESRVLTAISNDAVLMGTGTSADPTEDIDSDGDFVDVVANENDVEEELVSDVGSARNSFADMVVDDEVESNNETGNNLLRSLANERADREKLKAAPNAKKIKNKGRKLGGPSRPSQPANIVPAGDMDSDDEMAFLDAQIATVQNSHGRRVEGAGPGYRTIINGILLAQPKPVAKKTNAKATNALNAKLKAAQESRKVQTKKK